MKFDTHETDIYILPETQRERHILQVYKDNLKQNKNITSFWQFSNVKGQNWEGKQFLEIPFCKHLKNEILSLI